MRQRIRDSLAEAPPTLEGVATGLKMSPRSLQRHLGEEGVSFRALVEDARVVDSGASVDASTSGLKAFGASCNSGPECASGLCFNFNMDGPHCTKACTTATAAADCAPASFGCSGMNVCKIR